jgi:hypothetical protein
MPEGYCHRPPPGMNIFQSFRKVEIFKQLELNIEAWTAERQQVF